MRLTEIVFIAFISVLGGGVISTCINHDAQKSRKIKNYALDTMKYDVYNVRDASTGKNMTNNEKHIIAKGKRCFIDYTLNTNTHSDTSAIVVVKNRRIGLNKDWTAGLRRTCRYHTTGQSLYGASFSEGKRINDYLAGKGWKDQPGYVSIHSDNSIWNMQEHLEALTERMISERATNIQNVRLFSNYKILKKD